MENEFRKKLEENEQILYHGVADVTKTSKQYGRALLGFVVLSIFWLLAVIAVNTNGTIDINLFIIFIVLTLITFCMFYSFFYNMFFKHRNKDNEYFVTNKRIAAYNSKIGFRIENIADIQHIGIAREKDNYGDIIFNFYNGNLDAVKLENPMEIVTTMCNIKKGMSFEGVQAPRKVAAMICNINDRIHVYDDRPTVMGKKI